MPQPASAFVGFSSLKGCTDLPATRAATELETIQQLQELCDSSDAYGDTQLVPRLFEPVSLECGLDAWKHATISST